MYGSNIEKDNWLVGFSVTFFLSLVPLKADMERNLYSSILRCDASNSSQYSMDPGQQQRRDVCTVAAIWRNTLHPYCVESAVRHMTNDKSYCCPEQKQFITYSTYPLIGWGSIEEHAPLINAWEEAKILYSHNQHYKSQQTTMNFLVAVFWMESLRGQRIGH